MLTSSIHQVCAAIQRISDRPERRAARDQRLPGGRGQRPAGAEAVPGHRPPDRRTAGTSAPWKEPATATSRTATTTRHRVAASGPGHLPAHRGPRRPARLRHACQPRQPHRPGTITPTADTIPAQPRQKVLSGAVQEAITVARSPTRTAAPRAFPRPSLSLSVTASIDETSRPTFLRSGVTGLLEASVGRWLRFFIEAVPAAARPHHARAGARYAHSSPGRSPGSP
jgi:hypothetical protein